MYFIAWRLRKLTARGSRPHEHKIHGATIHETQFVIARAERHERPTRLYRPAQELCRGCLHTNHQNSQARAKNAHNGCMAVNRNQNRNQATANRNQNRDQATANRNKELLYIFRAVVFHYCLILGSDTTLREAQKKGR